MAEGYEPGRSVGVEVETATSEFAQAISNGGSTAICWQGLSSDKAIEPELAGSSESCAYGGVDEAGELAGGADAAVFEESKTGAIGELEKAHINAGTYTMSGSRTVAHGSCVTYADRLSVRPRH